MTELADLFFDRDDHAFVADHRAGAETGRIVATMRW
jgi:hypothetical protein